MRTYKKSTVTSHTNLSITILMPLFNSLRYGEEVLTRAFNSILNQTYNQKLIQIICLDDGSTDQTLNFLKKWQLSHPIKKNIKIISRLNKGLINTIIELISHVSTNYFTILDSDDYLEKQAIEKFLISSKNGAADVISSKYFCQNDPNIKKSKNRNQPFIYDEINDLNDYLISDKHTIKHFWWARAYRTEFIRKIDFSILSTTFKYYPDDLAFFCYVFHFVETFVFIPETTYNYCYYGNSISRSSSIQRDIDELKFFSNIFPLIKKVYDLKSQRDLLLNDYLLSWTKHGLKKRIKRILNS